MHAVLSLFVENCCIRVSKLPCVYRNVYNFTCVSSYTTAPLPVPPPNNTRAETVPSLPPAVAAQVEKPLAEQNLPWREIVLVQGPDVMFEVRGTLMIHLHV